MDVVFSLGNLLFEHDRVIVNGLGVFYTELEPASIHPVEHSFSPESKTLKFQFDENAADNLLPNSISLDSGNKVVEEFVQQVKIELAEGKKVQLKNIGFLFSHHTGEVLLEQDLKFNYVKRNFGLQGFIQEPVKEVVSPVTPIVTAPVHTDERKPRLGLYIIFVAAILLSIIVFWKWDYIQEFVSNDPIVNHSSQTQVDTVKAVVVDETNEQINTIGDSVINGTENEIEEDSLITEIEKFDSPIEVQIEDEVIEVESYTGPIYHVIAGCFKSASKADRLLNNLKSLGYSEASIEGKTPNGLIRVCYASYPERSQASNYMIKLQNQGRKGVWIQKGE